MANKDFRVVIDLGKFVAYLTKYVTKPKSDIIKGMIYIIKGVITQTLYRDESVENNLQKIIGKLLGSRQMSKQEVCHQIYNYGLYIVLIIYYYWFSS